MKLKNTDELRRRAKAHRRMRNFNQNAGYGSGTEPREVQACGIGCLAAPHTKSLFATVRAAFGMRMWDSDKERARLRTEFGISERLSWVIERGFEAEDGYEGFADEESRPEDDRAAFIVAVTEAMADGVNIDPGSLAKWDYPGVRPEERAEFITWLAHKCGRPVPAYARDIVAA